MTRPRYICPKCDSTNLNVTVITTAKLIQHEDSGEFETEVDGDHEWDEKSSMFCDSCAYTDNAEEFCTTQPKAIEHLNTLDLPYALWWFIENIDADHKDRNDIFFYLRERIRTELK